MAQLLGDQQPLLRPRSSWASLLEPANREVGFDNLTTQLEGGAGSIALFSDVLTLSELSYLIPKLSRNRLRGNWGSRLWSPALHA